MRKRIRVGILFGGKSAEHEVSIQSAKNIVNAINKEKFEPVLIGIDKAGGWHPLDSPQSLLNSGTSLPIRNLPDNVQSMTLLKRGGGLPIKMRISNTLEDLDVVFPVLHGPFGEDGTVQGLLRLLDIPFVGAGVPGSAIGMDKDVTKRLLRDAKIPTARFIVVKKDCFPKYEEVKEELGSPIFIKPANAGSSVGISRVSAKSEYAKALKNAFDFDRKILVEEAIDGREIECSVLGNESPIASVPGEIVTKHDFYSYDAKYVDKNGATIVIPAKVPSATSKNIQDLAIKAFKVLECEGMCRVDFFLKRDGALLVNEINTIPGFTNISMYPKLWEASGIPYSQLIERLINLALERHQKEQKLKTSYI